MTDYITFHAERQGDGTFTVYTSLGEGRNKEIVLTGVRPCNVNRTINRLIREGLKS